MLRVLSHVIATLGGLLIGYLLPDTTSSTVKGLLLTLEAVLITVYFLIRKKLRDATARLPTRQERFNVLNNEIDQARLTVTTLQEKLQESSNKISKLESEKAQLEQKTVTVDEKTLQEASDFLKKL